MPSSSKRKGNAFEVELVKQAQGWGFSSQRAWGSNGKSLGMHEEVDLLIEEFKVQAKRRKTLPKYLKCEHTDIVTFREDRGETYTLLKHETFLNILKMLKG